MYEIDPTMLIGWGLGLILTAIALTFVPAMVIKAGHRRALGRRCRGKLALTYDDGPDPLLTPRLVELLRRYGARATFFMLGFRAERSPAMADLLKQAGHELGCHAQMHLNCWRVWPWRANEDINRGYRAMERWLQPDSPYRPPYGKLTTWTWLLLRQRGAALCFWTQDGCDTHPVLPDPARVAERIMKAGGAVVLLHSHDRGSERERYVLALTEQLLIAARARGLDICTMDELIARRN